MEHWRNVWRNGFAPLLSTKALDKLCTALKEDNPQLIQGATTEPPPFQCVQDWPVTAACAIGYCGWAGEGFNTVTEVETYFAQKCYEADTVLGEPAACRYFLNFFDSTPREKMRSMLIEEVNIELGKRYSTIISEQ
jgi:hypothetical protein